MFFLYASEEALSVFLSAGLFMRGGHMFETCLKSGMKGIMRIRAGEKGTPALT